MSSQSFALPWPRPSSRPGSPLSQPRLLSLESTALPCTQQALSCLDAPMTGCKRWDRHTNRGCPEWLPLWSFLDSAILLGILKPLELTPWEECKTGIAGFHHALDATVTFEVARQRPGFHFTGGEAEEFSRTPPAVAELAWNPGL